MFNEYLSKHISATCLVLGIQYLLIIIENINISKYPLGQGLFKKQWLLFISIKGILY